MSILERFLQTVTRSEKREVEFKHTIALRIQSALEQKKWLQRDLADKMNLSEARISYILKGEANLTLRAIARLEEVSGYGAPVCRTAKSRAERSLGASHGCGSARRQLAASRHMVSGTGTHGRKITGRKQKLRHGTRQNIDVCVINKSYPASR